MSRSPERPRKCSVCRKAVEHLAWHGGYIATASYNELVVRRHTPGSSGRITHRDFVCDVCVTGVVSSRERVAVLLDLMLTL